MLVTDSCWTIFGQVICSNQIVMSICVSSNVYLIHCSCLIARNLLPGLKTCMEVSSYMDNRAVAQRGGSTSLFSEDNGKADMDYMVCAPLRA